jgi:uncharacterized protein YqgV (UPF0045/DUF77 family)
MKLSVEVSMYPLNQDYIPPIQAFIDNLNTYPNIKVNTNALSTQVSGEFELVSNAVTECIKKTISEFDNEGKKVVFVMKWLGIEI